MPYGLHIFGLVHLAILGIVPLTAVLLAVAQRKLLGKRKGIRVVLAILLFASTASYYGYFAGQGVKMFPHHVPLELCDVSLWLMIAALLTLRPAVFDVAYYLALAGASMSLLTPNLVNPTPFIAIQFFANHGLIVASALYLVWSGQARPRPGSVVRTMLALNGFAAIAGTFDFLFKTNYMFLRSKPPTVSLLDVLGPWPWYILACEAVGCGLVLLLYLPFRQAESNAVTEEIREGNEVQSPTSDKNRSPRRSPRTC